MIGLPTETKEDIEGIVKIVNRVNRLGKEITGRKININVSVAVFVPKAHTPFQWEPQEEAFLLSEKLKYLNATLRKKNIAYSYSDINRSCLEAVFARGDRKLNKVLERAHQSGCKFDAWREHFDFELWQKAFTDCGVKMEFYANRQREEDEVLPWEHISCGVTKEYFLNEKKKALKGETTPDCRFDVCTGCGVC